MKFIALPAAFALAAANPTKDGYCCVSSFRNDTQWAVPHVFSDFLGRRRAQLFREGCWLLRDGKLFRFCAGRSGQTEVKEWAVEGIRVVAASDGSPCLSLKIKRDRYHLSGRAKYTLRFSSSEKAQKWRELISGHVPIQRKEKRRQMYEVQETLEQQKSKFTKEEELFKSACLPVCLSACLPACLQHANEKLRAAREELNAKNEARRQEFQQYRKGAAQQILAYNNRVAALQRNIEEIEKETASLRQNAEDAIQLSTEQSLCLGRVLTSVDNVYERCLSRNQIMQHNTEIIGGAKKAEAEQRKLSERKAESRSQSPEKTRRSPRSPLLELFEPKEEPEHISAEVSEGKVTDASLKLQVMAAYITDYIAILETTRKDKRRILPKIGEQAMMEDDEDKDQIEWLPAKELKKREKEMLAAQQQNVQRGRERQLARSETASSGQSPSVSKTRISGDQLASAKYSTGS
uniref:PH domain-containing protein n=1 Tax=Chromera velia CCMP2878 TaxID=1169474 RepID=A0A0G4HKS4_9ALVE|eukprot:Cvel_1126.t1-p1 / transcript=Cvel_1126.t1 / gene=Cvel_1126 / organism=Chromera_velia_CCMP2878 / gene_product=hypothetical protein / transcript_product=hypothetical protein / location=Cvel_scaffold37:21150-31503(+) / protein_length=462 / sequence_SO=supercontig / SO=protein_coding / is_pseudo=false